MVVILLLLHLQKMSEIPAVYLPDLDALLDEDLGDLGYLDDDYISDDDGGDGVVDDGQITPPHAPQLTQPPPIGHAANPLAAPAHNGNLLPVALTFEDEEDEGMEPLTPEPLPQQQQQQQQDGADHPSKRRRLF